MTHIEQVHQYFQDYDIDTTDSKLDLVAVSQLVNLTVDQVVTLMCNLECTDLMQELIDGENFSFDPWNESDFNDSYHCMMSDMFGDEDEFEKDFRYE